MEGSSYCFWWSRSFWPKTEDCIGDTIGRHARSTFTIEYRFLFSVFWHIFKNSVVNKYVRDSGLQVGTRRLLIRHAKQNGHFRSAGLTIA